MIGLTNAPSLQLGGKNPVVIDPNCDLKTATNRLLWGKTVNAGQICVGPDYALVPRTFQDQFVNALKETCVFKLFKLQYCRHAFSSLVLKGSTLKVPPSRIPSRESYLPVTSYVSRVCWTTQKAPLSVEERLILPRISLPLRL
jgi:hypothetical protein